VTVTTSLSGTICRPYVMMNMRTKFEVSSLSRSRDISGV